MKKGDHSVVTLSSKACFSQSWALELKTFQSSKGLLIEAVQGKIHAENRPKKNQIKVRVIQIYCVMFVKCKAIVQLDAGRRRCGSINAINLDILQAEADLKIILKQIFQKKGGIQKS